MVIELSGVVWSKIISLIMKLNNRRALFFLIPSPNFLKSRLSATKVAKFAIQWLFWSFIFLQFSHWLEDPGKKFDQEQKS